MLILECESSWEVEYEFSEAGTLNRKLYKHACHNLAGNIHYIVTFHLVHFICKRECLNLDSAHYSLRKHLCTWLACSLSFCSETLSGTSLIFFHTSCMIALLKSEKERCLTWALTWELWCLSSLCSMPERCHCEALIYPRKPVKWEQGYLLWSDASIFVDVFFSKTDQHYHLLLVTDGL